MIDFRYHLVSIVSIFLALAVGIVLGAGPLQENIGNTLTSEVTRLRDDRTALRAELDEANQAAAARDAFTAASNKTLLAERLQGATLAMVVLPGADDDLVKATASTIADAGATVGATVTVLEAWTDPDKATFRDTLGEQLATSVQVPADAEGEIVDTVLARALLTKAGGSVTGGASALEGLSTGELIRYTPEDVKVATGAVVVSGPVTEGDEAEQEARATALVGLATALDRAGAGAVLVAGQSEPDSQPQQSVVSMTRADGDATRGLSTVDTAGIPMGQASVIFALMEQFAGNAGHYGLEADATAPFPALATK